MSLDYGQTGYPAYSKEAEDGRPVPCALGRPWVNADTQATLDKMRIPRTDPWGKPLDEFEGTFGRIARCVDEVLRTLSLDGPEKT